MGGGECAGVYRRVFCGWPGLELLDTAADGCGHFLGTDSRGVIAVGFHIVSDISTFSDDIRDGLFEFCGCGFFAEVFEHEFGGEDECGGVDLVLAFVFGCAAMCGFEDGAVDTDVGAWGDAESADESGAEVAEDIPVEVGHDEDVILFGFLDELHAHVVDEPFHVEDFAAVEFSGVGSGGGGDVGGEFRPFVFGSPGICDGAGDVIPEAVGELHDVGFGDGSHGAAAVIGGILEGVVCDACGAFDGDWFDADAGGFGSGGDFLATGGGVDLTDELFGDSFAGFEFDTGVEVFGVFTDDNEIDVAGFEEGADAFVGFAGANAGVESEFLAEVDVDAAKAFADGGCDGCFESDAVSADGFEDAFGDFTFGFDDFDAAFLDVPFDFHAGGFDAFASCFSDFGTDTITGKESDLMHWGSLAKRVRRRAGIPACTAGDEWRSVAEFGADGNIWGGRGSVDRAMSPLKKLSRVAH